MSGITIKGTPPSFPAATCAQGSTTTTQPSTPQPPDQSTATVGPQVIHATATQQASESPPRDLRFDTPLSRDFESHVPVDESCISRIYSRKIDERIVNVYHMSVFLNPTTGRVVDPAARETLNSVWQFIRSKPREFIPPVNGEELLQELLATQNNLVIQEWTQEIGGHTVDHASLCLASNPSFRPGKKCFFSLEPPSITARCTQGHIFSIDNIHAWMKQHKTKICPIGREHPLLAAGKTDVEIVCDASTTTLTPQTTAIVERDTSGLRWIAYIGFDLFRLPFVLARCVLDVVVEGPLTCLKPIQSWVIEFKGNFKNMPTKEEKLQKQYFDDMIRTADSERPTAASIDARFRAIEEDINTKMGLSADDKEHLLKILSKARGEAYKKLEDK